MIRAGRPGVRAPEQLQLRDSGSKQCSITAPPTDLGIERHGHVCTMEDACIAFCLLWGLACQPSR